MPSFSTKHLSMRDPEDPLSTSIFRGKEALRGIVIVVCKSNCFSPVPRTHGVGPWRSVVEYGFELLEEHKFSGFVQSEVIRRQTEHRGGSVAPTVPRGENPIRPLPSPLQRRPFVVRQWCPSHVRAPYSLGNPWHGICASDRQGRLCSSTFSFGVHCYS